MTELRQVFPIHTLLIILMNYYGAWTKGGALPQGRVLDDVSEGVGGVQLLYLSWGGHGSGLQPYGAQKS